MFYNHVNPVEPFLLYLKCDKRDKIAKNNFAINVKNGFSNSSVINDTCSFCYRTIATASDFFIYSESDRTID